MRSYLISPDWNNCTSSKAFTIILMPPTLEPISGLFWQRVSIHSMALLRSCESSSFLLILAMVCPRMKGKLAGSLSSQACMNLKHYTRSFITVRRVCLYSRSRMNEMNTSNFKAKMTGIECFEKFRSFFSSLIAFSRKDLACLIKMSFLRRS